MSELQNVHVLLPAHTLLALDWIAQFKTDQGPVKWSRSACIREALDEYIKRRPVVERGGVFVMVGPGADVEFAEQSLREALKTSPETRPADDDPRPPKTERETYRLLEIPGSGGDD